METFYDITSRDLDIWDTDLDPLHSDALKLSTDADMPDWYLERDSKLPQVILHDKLISDALIGTLPIKTEHSYSLNSDGDSMPDSPRSLHAKIEDMDEDCYPVISMSSATDSIRRVVDSSSNSTSSSHNNHSHSSSSSSSSNSTGHNNHHQQHRQSLKMQIDLQPQQLLQSSSMSDNVSTTSSCDEIDIDDTCIKDEPLSPSSSCPPSPVSPAYGINLNMANVAALTNADLVFEHKNGALQLSPASQSLLKNQQIILSGSTSLQQQRIIMPKLNIKMEQSIPTASVFSLPPTPPSSLPSDESEGNQSPDRRLASPVSPPNIQNQHSSPVTSSTSSHRRSHQGSTASAASTATALTASTHGSTSGGRVGYTGSSTRQPIHTPLISSQPKGSTGTLVLTEEEKRTLLAEGYPIPTRLPLTKAEEKSLKKIRRKIKNKISAQESRRKKKEYMDQLERKVELLVSENSDYRKRVESLEDSNANLMNQLTKLQALLSRQTSKKM